MNVTLLIKSTVLWSSRVNETEGNEGMREQRGREGIIAGFRKEMNPEFSSHLDSETVLRLLVY